MNKDHTIYDSKRIFRISSGIVFCLLLIAALAGNANAGQRTDRIHLPVTEADDYSPSGQKTTWSCVWFGSYPSAEVVDDSWDSVDSYALREGDLIRDNALYEKLSRADWQDSTLELDGVSYLRLASPETEKDREQHYRWDDRPWHYFAVSPIRWRILDMQDGKALLLADRMIDCMPFHEADEEVSWESSTLRSWLNGYSAESNLRGKDYTGIGLIDRAFSEKERKAILASPCRNQSNQVYGTSSGADTKDRLFILSNAEVYESAAAGSYGFEPSQNYDDPAKRFTSTLYAKFMGAWWSPAEAYAGNSFWFMRTSGYTARSVTYVCDFGYIYSKGTLVTCSDAGVLPAMWIDLHEAGPEYAGETVSTGIMRGKTDVSRNFPVPELADPKRVADENMPGGSYTVWNAVSFGHYPQTEITQDNDAGLYMDLEAADRDNVRLKGTDYLRLNDRWFRCDPIIWRVLELTDTTALLMADQCMDSLPFHGEYKDVFWEDSDLRKWLNSSFMETAFTEEERQGIAVTAVPNALNHYFGTACGSGTHDQVFILSEEEVFSSDKAVRYGFQPSDAVGDMGRRLKLTDYAAARGGWRSADSETRGIGFWFLRTNGYTRDNVVYVGEKGHLYNRGIPVTCRDAGIVPVIRVRLGHCPLKRAEDISSGY